MWNARAAESVWELPFQPYQLVQKRMVGAVQAVLLALTKAALASRDAHCLRVGFGRGQEPLHARAVPQDERDRIGLCCREFNFAQHEPGARHKGISGLPRSVARPRA